MSPAAIGVAAMGGDARQVLERIVDLERRGIPSTWLTTGGAGPDALTIYAAAAVRTSRISLGTSIIPTWPRHPITAVQQVSVIAGLAPGRIRLGVGPSHESGMKQTYGFDFRAPLTNQREYISIVKTLLGTGAVDFDGKQYHAHARLSGPIPGVPVMGSALRPKSYELCGEVADGAISWVCPHTYLVKTALPALNAGAAAAGRPAPPIIAHTPVCVTDDQAEARAAARQQLANYPRMPFYAGMFAEAGFPEALQTQQWSDAMLDAVFVSGNEKTVGDRLKSLFSQGIGEVLAHVIPSGPDPKKSTDRTLDLLAALAK
jgi:F420-dependent oxidoreductase-like protein